MFEVFWLESAINDLTRLRSHLAKVNPNAADKMARIIIDAIDKLQYFPLIGQAVEDLENCYDLFIEFGAIGYHLRYSVSYQKLCVIHIKHSKELEFKVQAGGEV